MKITLLEKIMIANILPSEGNIKTLTIVKDLKNKVQLTQKDIKDFAIIVNDKGSISWNEKGAKAKFEINFTELELNEVKLALQKLDKEKKITVDLMSLIDLFKIVGE